MSAVTDPFGADPTRAVPRRADLDAELEAAGSAVTRASASLVELEGHPGYGLLHAGGFTGDSAARREETLATVAALHHDLALYRGAVTAAREARGTRARPSAEELAAAHDALHGQTVTVTEEAVPLHRRGLLGPTSEVTRTSADTLLARMTAAFEAATAVVAAVAAVWDTVAAQLGPTDRAVAALRAEARAGGDGGVVADLETWAERLDGLRHAVLVDPLAHADAPEPVDPEALGEVGAGLAAVRATLREAAALRGGADDRVAALTARIDALAAQEADTAAVAGEAARLVVATPGLPRPHRRAPELRAALRDAHGDVRAGRLAAASAGFTAVESGLDAATEQAESDRAVLGGLLDRRAELRGRLRALRAKAGARGRAEDLALDALHSEVESLLWTAPCDLPAATVALRRYQRALEEES